MISACLPVGRVEKSPVLLYDFCEEVGSTAMSVDSVLDVSFELVFENGTIGDGFAWVEDGLLLDGDIDATTAVRSVEPVFERLEACHDSGEVTLEVWATPLHESQGGPTRIVALGSSVSNGGTDLALMMNPEWDVPGFVAVVRTSEDTSSNGQSMDWLGIPLLRATHFVIVHDATGTDTMYLDGEVAVTQPHAGDLSMWNPNFDLVLGNQPNYEVRNWAGTYHMVAIYCEALTEADVVQNYEAGHRPERG